MQKTLRALIGGLASLLLGILGVLVPAVSAANAAITTTYTGYGLHEVVRYVGHYKASTDGFSGGNTFADVNANGIGTIGALKPSSGATVVRAFLSSEGTWWNGSAYAEITRPPVVTLAGQSVSFYAKNYAQPFTNFLADVTPIVQNYFAGSPSGTAVSSPWSGTKYSLPLVYEATQNPYGLPTYSDGVALTVVFQDNSMTTDASVVYYFGSSNSAGQIFALSFDALPALPNNGTYSGSWLSLGSGWSQGGGQYSTVKAQNNLQAAQVGSPWTDMSGSAGGCDDSHGPDGVSPNNGCDSQHGLITVGGIGDSTANPTSIGQGQADDELYNLDQFLAAGVDRINLSTRNPSGDDNIFQAVMSVPFVLSGTAVFDANGGTGTMANQVSLVPAQLSANTFAKSGWTFVGWNTLADGAGIDYANQAVYPFSTDITLYAQWSQNTHTLTYDSQGGSAIQGANYTGTITSFPAAPTWASHTFNGWFAAPTGGSALTAPYTPSPFANVTIYAQWTTLSQPVTFDSQGGSAVAASTYSGTITTLPSAPTRAGFTFAGWFASGSGGSALAAPYTPSSFVAVTLYAQWLPVATPMIHHAVQFDTQGGTSVASLDYFYSFELPAAPTRIGYTFTGWFLTKAGGTPLSQQVEPRPLEDLTVFAQWQKTEYTATFDTQGGTAVAAIRFTDSIPLPAAPSRAGYRFLGWFASQSGGTVMNAAFVPSNLGDVTLYAQWSQIGSLTLWGFADGSAKANVKMLAVLKAYLAANPGYTKVTCVGVTEGPTVLSGDRKLAFNRADNICSVARAIIGADRVTITLATQTLVQVSARNRKVVLRFSER
ncbi:MAG: hypothetical protein RL605_489 [Actinomycetota bacterium]|jgi:uncharacterized repeat protein (TIGR02543 family)